MKRVALLGSTGSVGESALKVIESAADRFRVVGLTAHSNRRRLLEQASRHEPLYVAVSEENADFVKSELAGRATRVLAGEAGTRAVAVMEEADVVLIAISGAAALGPALAAARAGKTIALANKECLVMAGALIMDAARRSGGTILPVDSEHSAIFQALSGRDVADVRRIVLPASGGPFLDVDPAVMDKATPDQALKHPTWSMGKKISIDSATLMNKALEIIEAHWLFGLDADRIEALIHPESIVHGLVEWKDGSVTAQLSVPDMRFPVLYALSYPERIDGGLPSLSLAKAGTLTFRTPDINKFPALGLSRAALAAGGTAPAALASADEAAVHAFLDGRLLFGKIVPLIEQVLAAHRPRAVDSLETVLEVETWAKRKVREILSSD